MSAVSCCDDQEICDILNNFLVFRNYFGEIKSFAFCPFLLFSFPMFVQESLSSVQQVGSYKVLRMERERAEKTMTTDDKEAIKK